MITKVTNIDVASNGLRTHNKINGIQRQSKMAHLVRGMCSSSTKLQVSQNDICPIPTYQVGSTDIFNPSFLVAMRCR